MATASTSTTIDERPPTSCMQPRTRGAAPWPAFSWFWWSSGRRNEPGNPAPAAVGATQRGIFCGVTLSSQNPTAYGFLEARVDFDRSRSTC